MQLVDLEPLVRRTVERLIADNAPLLSVDVSEWTLSCILGGYLAEALEGWDVDCEYNRQGSEGGAKRMATGDLVRPDVVVHHRRLLGLDDNLLVVELKKRDPTPEDEGKLRHLTAVPVPPQTVQYQFGVAIGLERPTFDWFSEGQRIPLATLVAHPSALDAATPRRMRQDV